VKWNAIRDTFKHAFAVPGSEPLSSEEEALLERLAAFVVRRRLSAPAAFFLTSLKPLNYVGSQAMWVLQPLAELFVAPEEFLKAQRLLERRESMELLVQRIEQLQQSQAEQRKTEGKQKG